MPFTLTQGDLVQEALAVAIIQTQALNIAVKAPLGSGIYAELTELNGSKRVDLRFWKIDMSPTKVGVSLSLLQWKVVCSATQVVDDLISRVKDGEHVDWRYDLGEDVYVIIKAPQLTIRKYFIPLIFSVILIVPSCKTCKLEYICCCQLRNDKQM